MPPKKWGHFRGGSVFFEITNFFLINRLKFFLERLMDILDSCQDGSLIVSICTPYRHIVNYLWALFFTFFQFFFIIFIWKTLIPYWERPACLNIACHRLRHLVSWFIGCSLTWSMYRQQGTIFKFCSYFAIFTDFWATKKSLKVYNYVPDVCTSL